MQTGSLYLSRRSIRIKPHDDFFTRCSSRETSNIINQLSPEDNYHGGTSVAVPFNWESEPGTPKVKCRGEIPSLPPLTPPPSYFYSTPKGSVKSHSKPKLLNTFFSKRHRIMRKTREQQLSPASSSSSSSSSSSASSSSASSSRSSSPWPRSYSVPSSPLSTSSLYARNEQLSRARLFTDSRADHEEEEEYESSVSTPCFGRAASARSRGLCSTMLKVLLIRDQ